MDTSKANNRAEPTRHPLNVRRFYAGSESNYAESDLLSSFSPHYHIAPSG